MRRLWVSTFAAMAAGASLAACGGSTSNKFTDGNGQAPIDGGTSPSDAGSSQSGNRSGSSNESGSTVASSGNGSGSTSSSRANSSLQMFQTCIPLSCVGSCGQVPDGCGGTMQCAACGAGLTCNSLGHCVAADAGSDAGAANGCTPACTAGQVCVSTQVVGGCVGCNSGPPSYACATVPASCEFAVDCTCAKSLCPASFMCTAASPASVTCVEAVP
jgi:hypothetical protein